MRSRRGWQSCKGERKKGLQKEREGMDGIDGERVGENEINKNAHSKTSLFF